MILWRFRFELAVFLSAFLLFQIQPIAARWLLPIFGGGGSIWITCLFFFQTNLLFGYAYAHWLQCRTSPKHTLQVHFFLFGLSAFILIIFSIQPPVNQTILGSPVIGILKQLVLMVGLPFFLLSATGPLLSAWYAKIIPDRSPYRLYAFSNAGSLLALLSYPFFGGAKCNFKNAISIMEMWLWAIGIWFVERGFSFR